MLFKHEFPEPIFEGIKMFIYQNCINCNIKIKRYKLLKDSDGIIYYDNFDNRLRMEPKCIPPKAKKLIYKPIPSILDNRKESHLQADNHLHMRLPIEVPDSTLTYTSVDGIKTIKQKGFKIDGDSKSIDTIRRLNEKQKKDKKKQEPRFALPYQLCPKCNGVGTTSTLYFGTSSVCTCDVCNGNKIIPMYVIPIEIKPLLSGK